LVLSSPEVPNVLVAGKYRLTRLLGRGGMGSVWEGVHTTLGTRVAVKFIESEHAESVEARNRFENEARAAATLRSKHVVEIYDHGLAPDGRPFIVMEYLEGEPLDRRLDRMKRLSPKDTARILQQVCRALGKAHAAGIVHRDLKPENIFLVWDDEDRADIPKIVDFGIAKFTDRALGPSSATRTGSVLGTPYYMSPEQARGLRSVDHRADLWSLGVIAYRCIVGTLPFEGEAIGDLLVKLCTAPIPVPSQIAPDVPPGFDAFMARAMSREPESRFQSAQEFAEFLGVVCGLSVRGAFASGELTAMAPGPFPGTGALTPPPPQHGVTGAPLTQTPPPGSITRSGTGTIIAAAAAAVVVLGVGVAFLLKGVGTSDVVEPVPSHQSAATQPPSPPPVVPTAEPKAVAPPPAEASSVVTPAEPPSAPVRAPAAPSVRAATRPTVRRERAPERAPSPPPVPPPARRREIDVGY
jgi:eukaryotic-like serine/threonine-protein kinase